MIGPMVTIHIFWLYPKLIMVVLGACCVTAIGSKCLLLLNFKNNNRDDNCNDRDECNPTYTPNIGGYG